MVKCQPFHMVQTNINKLDLAIFKKCSIILKGGSKNQYNSHINKKKILVILTDADKAFDKI